MICEYHFIVTANDDDNRYCDDCGRQIDHDERPPDGWQLEDGRTVCHNCCVRDTTLMVDELIRFGLRERRGSDH